MSPTNEHREQARENTDELDSLRKEFELSGLGDRPHSMSAAKLRRLMELEYNPVEPAVCVETSRESRLEAQLNGLINCLANTQQEVEDLRQQIVTARAAVIRECAERLRETVISHCSGEHKHQRLQTPREVADELASAIESLIVEHEPDSALTSRDTEVREVLEGLRGANQCWCPDGQLLTHSETCRATAALYTKLQPGKEGEDVDK